MSDIESSPSRSGTRSRSRSTANKPSYKLDLEDPDLKDIEFDEERDEDYEEDGVEADIPGDNDDDDEDDEAEVSFEEGRGRASKRRITVEDDEDQSQIADTDRSDSNLSSSIPSKKVRMGHPVDSEGNPIPVVDDEYALPEDEEGEAKITKDGELLGDREFLVRTFTLYDRGNRQYMLSTEPARAVGLRDSHLFFQYHPNLYKVILSQEQKNNLIDRGVLPYSYRNRQIALVAARSVFREFGARIIKDGKNITDDYYVQRLREEGNLVEGTPVTDVEHKSIPRDSESVENLEVAPTSTGQPSYPAKTTVEYFDRKNSTAHAGASTFGSTKQLNSTNWLYQHAAACSRFNSDMYYDRVKVLLIDHQGLRDPYTNVLHLPQSTQATKVQGYYKREASAPLENDAEIVYETLIRDDDLTRVKTGLLDVPQEIYEGVVDEETKRAIEEQKEFESK
ncbi:hypothetical protein KAFR_0A00710 [Kazachstania africana CBS 2517]|uniref:Chromatin structure-remodeling complex subunit RSC7 n=1 Tax=Kazachstania africana (strain ATCC 22294 / BCRC 22015 / CBS 2517 / CECT 1963 / NBRC 1671 / NRRL Y-8276) TaxID=1071382 RepID=H2AMA9_KAZAF|nr:hypothetical protein KAFR_0A00710 [Kazachstania africana CBS 2517]CCF55509.1 hypothetical protein KAFR_0A00710 [Kazachstania africana CBS 2517]